MRAFATPVVGLLVGLMPFAVGASDADLSVSGVSVPVPTRQASTIPVASTVAADPAGGAYSATTYPYLYFFLSMDPALSGDDQLLGMRNVPALQPGEASTATISLSLPSEVFGTRHLIVILDGRSDTTPGNNQQVIPLTIVPPDLSVSAAVSSPARQGAGVQVLNTVTNDANGAAYPGNYPYLYFFLSTDETLSGDDALLTSRYLRSLQPGEASSAETTVPLPADVSGARHLIVVLDGRSDTTPGNNQQVIPLTIAAPDLSVRALVSPPVRQGSSLQVLTEVTNDPDGAAYSGSWGYLYLFLSTDATLSSEDALLASKTVPPLRLGEVSAGYTSVVLPASAFGPHHLIVVLDGRSDTTPVNDAVVLPIQIMPVNLVVTAAANPSMTLPGGTLVVRTAVTNDPAAPAFSGAYGTLSIYLSAGTSASGENRLLTSVTIPALQPGETSTRDTPVQLPSDFVGAGQVLVAIDGRADLDPAGNMVAIPIEVRSSLLPCEQIQCGEAGCVVALLSRGAACAQGGGCGQVCDGVSPHCQPAE